MEYCTSSNGESFSGTFPTREEAMREEIFGNGREPGEVFYIGQALECKASDFFDIDRLLEEMGEQAYDQVGEACESWPDLGKEEIEELDKQICSFLDEKVSVSFFRVDEIEKITVTPELIAKYDGEEGGKS